MIAPLGLATQASTTLARTHTRPTRLRSMAPRMQSPIQSPIQSPRESPLHPDLHPFLGSLGSLSLVLPLSSLRSYDRLEQSFVAGDCVKRVHRRPPAATKFVTRRHCRNSVFLSQSSRLTHHCGTTAHSISFLTTRSFWSYVDMLAAELRSCGLRTPSCRTLGIGCNFSPHFI